MTGLAPRPLLVHVCSFYRTSQVHARLYQHIHERFGFDQLVIVPTKDRGKSIVRQAESFGSLIEVPCLDMATSLSSQVRGRRIVRMLETHGVLRELAHRDIRLIHAHSAYMDGFAAARLARALDVDLALSFRMTDTQFCFRYRPYASLFMKRLVRIARHVVVISRGDAERIARRLAFPVEKIGYLGSGVDEFYIANARLDKPPVPAVSPVFLTMGKQGYRYKRVDLTIQACAAAAASLGHKRWTLQVIGMNEAEYRKTHGNSISQDVLLTHVQFLGRIEERAKVLAAMRNGTLFVLPSKETFGISFLEAISQCTPIVWLTRYAVDGVFDDVHIGVPAAAQTVAGVSDAIISALSINGAVLGPFEQNPVTRLGWEQLARRYGQLLLGNDGSESAVTG